MGIARESDMGQPFGCAEFAIAQLDFPQVGNIRDNIGPTQANIAFWNSLHFSGQAYGDCKLKPPETAKS